MDLSRHIRSIIFILWIISIIIGVGCGSKSESKLNIAVAANMQYAIEELIKDFSASSGIECNVILGSSGKLLAQIIEGAPYDIFVSADEKYPSELFNQGLTTGHPIIYAYGQLILLCGDSLWTDTEKVNFNGVKKFAIANAKTAPYGAAAEESLVYYGWDEKLEDKKVFGESISQTNLFLTTGAAEMGITSQSIVYSGKLNPIPNFLILSSESYSPLAQAAVMLNSSSKKEVATIFFNYLLSPEARTVLKKFGYLVSES